MRQRITAFLEWVVQPKVQLKLNGVLTCVWILMVPISIATGWITSVAYVSALSIWALVSGHLSAYIASKVEKKQDEDGLSEEQYDRLIAILDAHGLDSDGDGD